MNIQQGQKYLWRIPECEQKKICEFAATYNVSFPVIQALLSRGFTSRKQIDEFLFSSFEKDVYHPSLLKDAEKTVSRILEARDKNEKILIFGDYDVDGITSSALMMICLLPLKMPVNFYLPHRVKDGYGISSKIVKRAAENDFKVIITVDNGITAFEPADVAKEYGIDLIITDHHRPHDKVPDAYAIVNPNQDDCTYPFKHFAGVGVTFKILSLLYEKLNLELPPKAYELLLLGTIADVVPLTGENRFWVRHGLHYINSTESHSFTVLKQNGKVTKSIVDSIDIGFCITPQINALGRLEDPRQGVKFLIGSDIQEVKEVGTVLFELNQIRKEIERSIVDQVVEKIESKQIDLDKENIILAASESWPPGVIGLVASRLVSKYGKPTLLFHITKDGIAKGSCRSIPEFNMFDALTASQEIITQFGGHSLAAGLSLPIDNLVRLKKNLEERIIQELSEFDLQQKITLDAEIKLTDINKKFITDIELLQPFGNSNEQLRFYLQNVSLVQKPVLLKNAHVKCNIFSDGIIKPVIFFNRPELFHILSQDKQFDMAVQVTQNHWNGRINLELIGLDIAYSKGRKE